MTVILADNQEITRAGLMYVCGSNCDWLCQHATDKASLMALLAEDANAVVVLDYTLFDFNDEAELLILNERFPQTQWVLFSFELTLDFVRRLVAQSQNFSVLLKDSPLDEIRSCLSQAAKGRRYICQRMMETMLAPQIKTEEETRLTHTETEILKDIALGMTTREIAEKRVSSFHTVNTHRKNIFRKIGVNNVHEATKYALRAGLVDAAEYYI